MFSIIAAIGKNRELGKKNGLIFHIPEDMRYFRDTTKGHAVVMGRNTWESLPGKLSERQNIVVSKTPAPDADVTITNLNDYISQHQHTPEEIFIIGGGMIYTAFLPYAKHLYLTEISASAPDADVFFPEFDKSKYVKNIIRKGSQDGLNYTFAKYILK